MHSRENHHRDINNTCTHSSSNSVFTLYPTPMVLPLPRQLFPYLSLPSSHRNIVGDLPPVLKPSQLNQCKASLSRSAPAPAPPAALARAETARGILSSQPSGSGPRGTVLRLRTVSVLPAERSPLLEELPAGRPPPASSLSLSPTREKRAGSGMGEEGIELGPSRGAFAFPRLSGSTKVQVWQRCVNPCHLVSQCWPLSSSKLVTVSRPWSPLGNHQATVLEPVAASRACPLPNSSGPARVPLQGGQGQHCCPI